MHSPDASRQPTSSDRTWELLAAVLTGTATSEEIAALDAAKVADATVQRRADLMRRIWDQAEPPRRVEAGEFAKQADRLMQRIDSDVPHESRIGADRHGVPSLPGKSRNGVRSFPWPFRAAVAAGMFAAAAVLWMGGTGNSGPTEARYTTRAGERITVVRPNGTKIIVGPSSTMAIASAYGNTTVTLEGEALFTVTSQANRAFTVRTGTVDARVLGTTFLVRRYATDRDVRIAVADGRVAIHGRHTVTLSAGMLGIVRDSGMVRVASPVPVNEITALRTGQLVFRETPLRDVVLDLSRAYDVDLRVADTALAKHLLTTRVSVSTQPLDGVLTPLLETLDAHAVRNGRVITIRPGRTSVRRPSPSHLVSESSYGK
jgi:ferric-dicitrate binding protein FerR (iron transport regulator)